MSRYISLFILYFTLLAPAYGQPAGPLSLTLPEAIRIALERNESLQIARQDLQKARQQVREATADALPQLHFSVTYNRNWLLPQIVFDTPEGPQNFTIGTRNNLDGNLSLRQALYSGGKVGAARSVAQSFSRYSRESLRAARQRLWAEVEIAFYDVLLARDLVRVSELALDRAKANLKQVHSLKEAGRASDYDLLRAQVQVAERRPDSIRAQNTLILTEIGFKNTVGLDPDRPFNLTGDLNRRPRIDVDDPDALIRMGLEDRPEMRQSGYELNMRRQAVRVSRSESLPSLDLQVNGQVQIQSSKLEIDPDDAHQSWSSGITLNIPLFDGFRTGARVAQARVDVRRAELETDRLERDIRLEIRQVWLSLKEAEERLAAQAQAVDQSRKGLQISESRYTSGLGTQLEVMDAQLALLRAEIEHARARRDRAAALVGLELAVGVLGTPPGEEDTQNR